MRWRQENRHLSDSETNHNPRGAPSRVPGSSAPRFVESSGYSIVSPSYKPSKDPSPVQIIKPASLPSETPTKIPSHVTKELQGANPRKMLMEYPSGDPTSAPSTIPYDKPSSNPRSQPSSDPYVLKRGIQEAQVCLQKDIILFILHIILSSSSSQRVTWMFQ